jgi:hypothetical protein
MKIVPTSLPRNLSLTIVKRGTIGFIGFIPSPLSWWIRHYFEKEGVRKFMKGFKALLAQDIHGPPDPRLLSDTRDYFRSLELLLSLGVDILCEGHFGVYKGRKAVERFIRSFCSQ